jgi:hypothetical protein
LQIRATPGKTTTGFTAHEKDKGIRA